jgi:hypothetical protein
MISRVLSWPITTGRRLSCVTLAALVVSGAICWFLRISGPRDLEALLGMASECPPVWKQLAFRRYTAGDSARELLRRFPPTQREEFGRYGIYCYGVGPCISFTGLSVVTRDGKLISAGAGSCRWHFTFFRTEDPELGRQYTAFAQERHRAGERKRLDTLVGELRRFYITQSRWPTNEAEFGWFVTGEKPRRDAALDKWLMARYGIRNPKLPSEPPNPLGIAFTFRDDGALIMALKGEANLVQTVKRPIE